MSAETLSEGFLSEETLTMVAGALLSLAFSYVPGLAEKYAGLQPTTKRLVMLGLLVLAAAGIFGLACSGWGADFGIELSCDPAGGIYLAKMLILAITANQATYLISPRVRHSRIRIQRG